jgi:hypothetical protein
MRCSIRPVSSQPLLTHWDARKVMEEHFGRWTPSAVPERQEGAPYVVRWERGLAHIFAGEEIQAGKGTSNTSFEDAIERLAASRPELVRFALGEPEGLYQQLLRQRANMGQQLFRVREAPLDLDTCVRLEALPPALRALRARLRPRVEFSRERGPIVRRVDILEQAMLHRIVAFVEGASAEWNRGTGLTASVLARAVLETVGVWWCALTEAESHLVSGALEQYDALIERVFWGTRDPSAPVKGLKPIGVPQSIQQLEKRFPGVETTYHSLCEVAHPNGLGFFSLHEYEFETFDAVFDLQAHAESQLTDLVRALRLDIAEECFAASQNLASQVIDLWRARQASGS